jgi:hypothetical protein
MAASTVGYAFLSVIMTFSSQHGSVPSVSQVTQVFTTKQGCINQLDAAVPDANKRTELARWKMDTIEWPYKAYVNTTATCSPLE